MNLPFDDISRRVFNSLLDEMFDSNYWSDGPLTRRFEEEFSDFVKLPHGVALSSGGMALLGLLEYIGVLGAEVIVPTNTFMATPLAVKRAGGNVVFADCSKNDLCLSLNEVKRLTNMNTKAVIVVHIGGHIAFEIEEIAAFCKEKGLALIEDCAHAHGAMYNGKAAGSWGIGGAYSFYATKTMPTGEGGMVVTKDSGVAEWLKMWRNYGKKVESRCGKILITYPFHNGFHARMPETTVALGIVQLQRLPEIID
jgi:dTDP-4-amino-4,6-dideoxygalactose transaminase